MLWTQNTWAAGDNRAAAYRCLNGHVLDPSMTRECPACGVHDTVHDNHIGRASPWVSGTCANRRKGAARICAVM
jgi:hypothetical protein